MSNYLPDVLEIKYNMLSALNWYNFSPMIMPCQSWNINYNSVFITRPYYDLKILLNRSLRSKDFIC